METGEIIKKLRKEKGITQEELANVLGLQKSAIAKYENGRVFEKSMPQSRPQKHA